jgi:hypothetical protein
MRRELNIAAPVIGDEKEPRDQLVRHPVEEQGEHLALARRLEISEKTVKSHLTSIFRQIGVTDRVQAVLWAERQGLRSELRP